MSELSAQDVNAIDEVHRRWISEELAGNHSQVIQFCTDDVMWIPPDAQPLVGKEAIAKYLSDNPVELKNVQVKDVLIRGSDSVAYLTSGYQSRFVAEGQTDVQEGTGTHLWILRKAGDVWRVAIVAWSSWESG